MLVQKYIKKNEWKMFDKKVSSIDPHLVVDRLYGSDELVNLQISFNNGFNYDLVYDYESKTIKDSNYLPEYKQKQLIGLLTKYGLLNQTQGHTIDEMGEAIKPLLINIKRSQTNAKDE